MRPALAILCRALLAPGPGLAAEPSLQEALLRAKPAVALVIAEVAGEVSVSCGVGGEKRVSPQPLRETGTGWVIAPSGWMLTNAHVLSSAPKPRRTSEEQLPPRAAPHAPRQARPPPPP